MDSQNLGSKWLMLPVVYSVYFLFPLPDGGGKKASSLHLFSLMVNGMADGADYLEG